MPELRCFAPVIGLNTAQWQCHVICHLCLNTARDEGPPPDQPSPPDHLAERTNLFSTLINPPMNIYNISTILRLVLWYFKSPYILGELVLTVSSRLLLVLFEDFHEISFLKKCEYIKDGCDHSPHFSHSNIRRKKSWLKMPDFSP